MPLKSSTLTLLLVGLLWLAPGLEPASAKGFLGFGKKKESAAPVPPPSSGGTVYLTKYGPLTAAQYRARLKIEQDKVKEAVRRAAERREVESQARQKSAERAAQDKAKAAKAAAEKAAEERARTERLSAKEAEAEKKRAELSAKKVAAQKKVEADRARTEKAEKEKEKKRLEALESRALKIIEEQEKASRSRADASSSRSPVEALSPAERIIAMERIARDLAAQRRKSSSATEIVSASSLGLTSAGSASPSKKTASSSSSSKIDSLNRSIFEIVRKRKGSAAPLKRLEEGDLFLTTNKRTPFYYYNPLQLVVPDFFLSDGTQVALLKRGKIWSDVRLEDGKEGVIANDFLVAAPVVEIELPVDTVAATSGRPAGFQYTAIPKDYVPPDLPGEADFEDRMPSPLLLPPLQSDAP